MERVGVNVISAALTCRAVVGAAAGLHDATDGGAAIQTGFSGPVVDAQSFLKTGGSLLGAPIIKQPVALAITCEIKRHRAACGNGRRQNVPKGANKAFALCAGEATGCLARGKVCTMKSFAGIDVSHAGHHGLIKQLDLDRLTTPAQAGMKLFAVKGVAQGFGAQGGQRCRIEGQSTEVAGVLKNKMFPAQFKDNDGMLGMQSTCWLEIHAPRHPKVSQQSERPGIATGRFHLEQQIFTPPHDGKKLGTNKPLTKLTHGVGADAFGAVNLHPADSPPGQQEGQVLDKNLDLRKLRHT